MAKSTTFDSDLLKMIFNANGITNLCDNTATGPLTNLYVSLHTADPTAAGNQASSEVAYTSYARVAVARTSSGWTLTSNSSVTQVTPAATISFPAGTGGSGNVTFFAVGANSSGAGKVFYSGNVSPLIVTGNGVTPQLTTATVITEA